MEHRQEHDHLARHLPEPALKALAAAYRRTGSLDAGTQALEEALLDEVVGSWRELYLTGTAERFRHSCDRRQRELVGFTVSYLGPLFPRERRQSSRWVCLGDREVEELLLHLRRDVKKALGTRKLNERQLAAVELESQRRALAGLITAAAARDEDDRAAATFLRERDLPPVAAVYAARLGSRRPLLTALAVEDWDEILRIWTRGWRPALEALKLRLAARVDGVAPGGAIDLVTRY